MLDFGVLIHKKLKKDSVDEYEYTLYIANDQIKECVVIPITDPTELEAIGVMVVEL